MKTVNTGATAAAAYTTPTPENVTELRLDLAKLYSEIRNGQIKLDAAKEATNAAGKILKAVAVQVAYGEMLKDKRKIPFAE